MGSHVVFYRSSPVLPRQDQTLARAMLLVAAWLFFVLSRLHNYTDTVQFKNQTGRLMPVIVQEVTMPNPARILEKLRARPTSIGYDQILPLLSELGWRVREGKTGSHFVCTSPRGYNITAVRHKGQVSRIYLDMLLKEIDRSGDI
ncbi:MAG: hypothetical protein ACR2OU_15585 [Thermomicrobiales bacterium]